MSYKVLIANRGEIALRAMRACKELNIKTVAVYSTADRDLKHLKFADESVCIGPASPTLSYLNAAAILSAAELTEVDGIYPGYGFLAEDPNFDGFNAKDTFSGEAQGVYRSFYETFCYAYEGGRNFFQNPPSLSWKF